MKRRTRSAAETRAFAAAMARGLRAGAVLALVGGFGSGKTTFVQGLAEGLGVPDLRAVCSPTFVMMNVYGGGRLPLYHVDATRLEDPREVYGLGWEEGEKGVTAIEWGERVEGVLSGDVVRVEMTVRGETDREIEVKGLEKRSRGHRKSL
jgi:tRNA threonylcarbamoyladenosine biosynthesis protein TsaE